MPRQPGLLPETAGFVDHRQAEVLPQGQRELAVQVVAGRVQHGRAEPLDQPGGQVVAQAGRGVGPRWQPVWQQPVVRHAVDQGDPAAIEVALGDRETGLGQHVRIQAGLLLGQRDLLGADGVTGVGGRQRVGDQVQHPARLGLERPAPPWQPLGPRDALFQHVQLAAERAEDLGLLAAGYPVQHGHPGP